MWLGSHFFSQATPVGLLNSVGIPNPNGIALVGLLLSPLPSLFAVSVILGCISSGAALLAVAPGRENLRRLWPALVVLWSSVHLRGAGGELWGQWLMIPINLLFVAPALAYLRRPRLVHWAFVAVLVLAAPAIYLAGFVNAATFSVIWAAVVSYERRQSQGEASPRWIHVAAVLAPIVVAAAVVIWIPYFRVVSLPALTHSVGLPVSGRLAEAASALFLLPAALGDLLRCGLAPLPAGGRDRPSRGPCSCPSD
jgi:hypothetical protein